MLAARVHALGEPPVVEEVADPVPRDDEALIRVSAGAVGHVDRDIMGGGFVRHPPLPYVPGVEGAGAVVRSAAIPEGTHVWFRGAGLGTVANGTWSELAAVREVALMPVPEGVEPMVAGTFFTAATSAHAALHDVGEIRAGERVAVRGAAGAVGSLATQLAILAGAGEVVGVVSGPDRPVPDGRPLGRDGPRSRGTRPRRRRRRGPPDRHGRRFRSGGPDRGRRSRAAGSCWSATPPEPGPSWTCPASCTATFRLLPLNMFRREHAARAAASGLLEQLARGELSLEVTPFPLAEVGRALEALERGTVSGRIALVP